jgi:Secretion system C-terminal sorting domain
MKKIIILGVFFALFSCIQIFGQNLVATCSSLDVTGVTAPTNIFIDVATKQTNQNCTKLLIWGSSAQPQYLLAQFDGTNFVTVRTWQISSLFTNLAKGTYRITIRNPTALIQSDCGNGIRLINSIGQHIGFFGTWVQTNTASAVVGAPVQSDNQYTFLNGNSTQILSNMFDPSEPIKINTSACKDFNRYGIAILEYWYGNTNLPGRWRALNTSVPSSIVNSSGLIDNTQRRLGGVLNEENLRTLWDPTGSDPNWQFIPGNTYRVQVTLSNSACASWIDNLQTFYVCYPNSGCRGGFDQSKIEPVISPNPVSQSFRLEGIIFNPTSGVKDELIIHDLAGRLVKGFKAIQNNEFDVSDLNTGIYFVSVLRDDHKVFTKKLMVNRL